MSLEWKIRLIVTGIAFIIIVASIYFIDLFKIEQIRKGKRKKRNNKEIRVLEIQFLYFKYQINKERLCNAKFALLFAVIDAFIICGTIIVIALIPWALAFQLLVGFVLLMGLIYSIYGILGTILIKKGYQNEIKRN